MIKGAILDLDGTLADTAWVHEEGWRRALRDLGIEARVDVKRLLGKRAPEIAMELAGGNEELARMLLEAKNRHFLSLVRQARPKECAVDLLKTLKSLGLKLAIVTSSNRVSAYSVLESTGMLSLVDYVVTGDDVNRGKPDPEPMVKALGLMGYGPMEVVGIGDTIHDYLAYTRAGVSLVFIILNPLVMENVPELKGTILVDSLCTLDKLLSTLVPR